MRNRPGRAHAAGAWVAARVAVPVAAAATVLLALAAGAGAAVSARAVSSGDTCTATGSGNSFVINLTIPSGGPAQGGFAFGTANTTISNAVIAAVGGTFSQTNLPANTSGAWLFNGNAPTSGGLTANVQTARSLSGAVSFTVVPLPVSVQGQSTGTAQGFDPITCAVSGSAGTAKPTTTTSPSSISTPGKAGGAPVQAPGTIHIWVTPGMGPVGRIVVTGAIGDYGTATTTDANGKVDDNGHFVMIKLRRGTLRVDSTVFDRAMNRAHPMINSTTCSVEFGGSGPVKLTAGTGAYTGIAGTLQLRATFVGVDPMFTSGTRKGKCDLRASTQPVAFFGSITGSGVVRYG